MSLFRTQFEFPILHVRNLSYETTSEELYNLFGQHGNIHQIRLGSEETKGQALIIYKNYKSCTEASDKLKGVNLNGRYLVCNIYQVDKDDAMKVRDELFKDKQDALNHDGDED